MNAAGGTAEGLKEIEPHCMLTGTFKEERREEHGMRNMSSISDRVIGEAVEAYLGREGIELLDRGCGGFIDFVGRDTVTSELVLLAVQAGDGTADLRLAAA